MKVYFFGLGYIMIRIRERVSGHFNSISESFIIFALKVTIEH